LELAANYGLIVGVPSKSSNGGKKSGGSSIVSRLFLLLLLAVAGLVGWYWWQAHDPSRTEKPTLDKYVDVEKIKRAPDVLTNVDWQGLSNRIATNLPWTEAKGTNPTTTMTNRTVVVSTNLVTRPVKPGRTNEVAKPALPIPIVTNSVTSATNTVIPNTTEEGARPVQNGLEAQVALARLGFSPGSIDGAMGSQSRAAIRGFQKRSGLPQSGELDAATKSALTIKLPLYTTYTVTQEDISSLRPLGKTWLAKSEQDRLAYETVLELVAEKFQSYPAFIKQLNREVNWEEVPAGTTLTVPNVASPKPTGRAAYVTILLADRLLQVFDSKDRLMAQFPCSIAQKVDKRPVGVVRVKVAAENPNYRFNPEIFPESEEAKKLNRVLMIPPGPNNPVGVAWIGLDKPGYGIHGTPGPEAVGRTESHGCFRLANWNAAYLIKLVWLDMPVYVEP
jgi:lipoprotein-anchoring transpeptidase ErfK/SrfK